MSQETAFAAFKITHAESLEWFGKEVQNFRTGRVKVSLIDSLPVEHYGARTPLQGLASLSVSDARTIVITPWDSSALPAIEKTITDAQLGIQPIVDGTLIRLSFPSLNEEMREKTIKMLHKKGEEARVRLRKGRDEALSLLKKEKENSDITEDDFYDGKETLDKLIDAANSEIEAIIKKKEEEIRTI